MASFKAIFPVLQELFAKNHRGGGPFGPPPPAGRGLRAGSVTWKEACFEVNAAAGTAHF